MPRQNWGKIKPNGRRIGYESQDKELENAISKISNSNKDGSNTLKTYKKNSTFLAILPFLNSPLANLPLANLPLANLPFANLPFANPPLPGAPLANSSLANPPLANPLLLNPPMPNPPLANLLFIRNNLNRL
jgi:hypothetical protein